MPNSRIALPCKVWQSGREYVASLRTPGGDAVEISYKSPADARKKLAAKVSGQLADHAERERNSRRRIIACNDGTVLLVKFSSCWGYFIATDRQSYASSSWRDETFEEALDRSREHAAESYGGVRYECSF